LGFEEKGAPYEVVALGPDGSKSPAHLARHPFGRVPALTHGDFTLYETQAILRYIDRVLPGPSLTPAEPRVEARMNQLCGITDWYVMPHVTMGIAFERLVAPRLGRPTDEAKVAVSLSHAKLCIAEIARLLGSAPFMTGDEISLADLHLAPHLAFFALAPEAKIMLEPYTSLTAWIARMNARPSLCNATAEKLTARAVPNAARGQ
jgi:glutathione S-transferase